MKRVVSVSLGSSKRDHRARIDLLGEPFDVERVGLDGSIERASELLRSLDGKVDALGLGGIDVYLQVGSERFALRDGLRLIESVKRTPIVDGSGLKDTLERRSIDRFEELSGVAPRGAKVLMVSALDRFGMAQALVEAGADVLFGDFIFALDLDKPVRDIREFEALARRYLPDACRLPFQFFYPTGKRQDQPSEPKYPQYYDEARIIAGDFHFMRRFMPARMDGKIVLTNTVTQADVDDLQARGVARLITTTPAVEGRSFGTNVVEAMLLAYLGRARADASDYLAAIDQLDLRPRVVRFDATA